MAPLSDRYVWFDNVRVEHAEMGLRCIVNGKAVPLPEVILHPDCKLENAGDVGRLGVPAQWALMHGLLSPETN